MNSQVEGACAFAWRNYLLLHNDVSEDDNRRSDVHRCVTNLFNASGGEYTFCLLQIAAVAYLKTLDESHDAQEARRAANQALAEYSSTTRHSPLNQTSAPRLVPDKE
jgi:hypothetical protein